MEGKEEGAFPQTTLERKKKVQERKILLIPYYLDVWMQWTAWWRNPHPGNSYGWEWWSQMNSSTHKWAAYAHIHTHTHTTHTDAYCVLYILLHSYDPHIPFFPHVIIFQRQSCILAWMVSLLKTWRKTIRMLLKGKRRKKGEALAVRPV